MPEFPKAITVELHVHPASDCYGCEALSDRAAFELRERIAAAVEVAYRKECPCSNNHLSAADLRRVVMDA